MPSWRLLSNHGLTLICLARNPEMTLREIGDWVGITERTAHQITKELSAEGYVSRDKVNGRNRYSVNPEMHLQHTEMDEHTVGELLAMLIDKPRERAVLQEGSQGSPKRRGVPRSESERRSPR
jgi:Winged helix-turn-helix DNA-binding